MNLTNGLYSLENTRKAHYGEFVANCRIRGKKQTRMQKRPQWMCKVEIILPPFRGKNSVSSYHIISIQLIISPYLCKRKKKKEKKSEENSKSRRNFRDDIIRCSLSCLRSLIHLPILPCLLPRFRRTNPSPPPTAINSLPAGKSFWNFFLFFSFLRAAAQLLFFTRVA